MLITSLHIFTHVHSFRKFLSFSCNQLFYLPIKTTIHQYKFAAVFAKLTEILVRDITPSNFEVFRNSGKFCMFFWF